MSLATIPDLWPIALEPTDKQLAPVAILRQQGHHLGQRTGNAVYGEVESWADSVPDTNVPSTSRFHHKLTLVSAYLGYRRDVVAISHLESLYPVTAASLDLRSTAGLEVGSEILNTPEELVEFLRTAFSREEVLRSIQVILSQTRDLDADDE